MRCRANICGRWLYPGYPHRMLTTCAETINRDLLTLIKP
jgi:hypothetical protein